MTLFRVLILASFRANDGTKIVLFCEPCALD